MVARMVPGQDFRDSLSMTFANPSSSPLDLDRLSSATALARDRTPDLARGLGLLGIAVVNASLLAPHSVTSTADRISSVLVTGLMENRSWPMFAVMFGFGIAAIAAKIDRQGLDTKTRNRVLRRRNWWLVAFGLSQVVLVYWGDILGVYGLTGMAVVALLDRSTRTKVIFGVASVSLWLIGNIVLNLGGGTDEVPDSANYLTSIGERLEVFVFWTSANSILLTHLAPMLVGVALFKMGALHHPANHLGLHRRLAVGGLAVGLVGAVPLCLINAGTWVPSDAVHATALGLHALTGLAQGIGYVSLIAIWSARRAPSAAQTGPAALVAAIGRRSLTVYFVHSILLGLALSAWAFDLAPRLTTASTYALGLVVWIVCAGVALLISAMGRRGPAEVLLRRLTYGRTGTEVN